MAKTAKSAAPKKKSASAKAAPKATPKVEAKAALKSPAKAPAKKAGAKAVKPAPKSAAAKSPAKPAVKAPVKPVAASKAKAPATPPPVVAKAPSVALVPKPGKAPAKPAALKTAPVSPSKKPDLKVVEPKPTPSLMGKVEIVDEADDKGAAPKKKRSEKDPLAGLDKITDPAAKWAALSEKAALIPTAPYKMSGSFEPKTGLQHKVLGWGYVLSALNDRLEVLFKDGVRILISNYKAT